MAEKELSVEEKRKIGEAYYARLSDGDIEHFLEDVWHVLFYSSSQRQYPKDPTHALNAIDMLIAEAEKRFGHVEPAPISTFLYNRDMTNADGKVSNEFERSNLDKSPDNHPEFAAREAKIFALIDSMRYSSGDEISCYRQGKGYYKDFGDSGAFYDYEFIGARSSFPTTKVTLQDIEEHIDYDLCNLGGIGINAIIPFRCSGEYKRDVSDLLVAKDNVRKVRKEGINALPKEMKEQIVSKIKNSKVSSDFVKKHINELTNPANREAIEEAYEIIDDWENYKPSKVTKDLKVIKDLGNSRSR